MSRSLPCSMPHMTPNGSFIVGTRRFALVHVRNREWLKNEVSVYGGVLVPIEVPASQREAWAAGFLSGSAKRVHDVDLPRTCDDPVDGEWDDAQPNLVKPLTEEG